MKAKIIGGNLDGMEFEVSLQTEKEIKEKTDKYANIKEYCRKNKVYSGVYAKFTVAKAGEYNHVRVPLPIVNNNWTFAAFDWVKTFCEYFKNKHCCWPHHNIQLDCVKYLWIKV